MLRKIRSHVSRKWGKRSLGHRANAMTPVSRIELQQFTSASRFYLVESIAKPGAPMMISDGTTEMLAAFLDLQDAELVAGENEGNVVGCSFMQLVEIWAESGMRVMLCYPDGQLGEMLFESSAVIGSEGNLRFLGDDDPKG